MLPRLKRQITTAKNSNVFSMSSMKSEAFAMSSMKSEALVKSVNLDLPNEQAGAGSNELDAADVPLVPSLQDKAQACGFLETMEAADWNDGLEFLTMWGGRPEAIKRELTSLSQVKQALVWMCQRFRQPREDVAKPWTKAWKAVCDKLRELLVSGNDVYDRRQAYSYIVDNCFHCEFVEVAKLMPNTLGWPIIKALSSAAEGLSIDITSQFLAHPSEGFFFLWYGTLWQEKKERLQLRKSRALPTAGDVASELLRVHDEVDLDQTVYRCSTMQGGTRTSFDYPFLRRGSTRLGSVGSTGLGSAAGLGRGRSAALLYSSPTRGSGDFFSPLAASASGAAGGAALRRAYTRAVDGESPQAMEEGRFDEDDEVTSLASCPMRESATSVLEALASRCVLRRRRWAASRRMQLMLNIVLGSHDACIERLIAAPRLFLAFGQEEEALQFLIAMLLDLDTKQMMSHFDRLQEQLQRFIRYHTNPLFSCLRLTAAVSKLCKRSSLAQDIWHGEHARLKRAAVQIFELLPQDAFDRIFENTGQRQTFMKLAFHEAAECLEMMDAPRFQDYLRTRWNGALPLLEDVQTPEDYVEYCRSWLDPNTLIFSPKLRVMFHALSFVLFTVFLQLLPSDFFVVCALRPSATHLLLWATVLGHVLQVAAGQARRFELFLVLLYLVLLFHCVAPWATPLLGLDGDPLLSQDAVEMVWGAAVCCMTLRWLKFFSCFPRFGEQLSTITNMLQEMSSFLVIFFLFLLAFAMLFVRLRPEDSNYVNLPTAVVTMFRGSLIDFELGDMIMEARANQLIWGEVVAFVVFLLIAAVLLLNFLISIMNSTYESVRARGNTESAKAFLETISDGESHNFWEIDALPPPFNTVYAVLLPLHFAVASVRALCFAPRDPHKRGQYLRFLREHEAPPLLMSVLVLPAALLVVVVATLPGFIIMLFAGPLLPCTPWLLHYDEDYQSSWDFARYHLLIPTLWLGDAYWSCIGERVDGLRSCTRRVLMPFLCAGMAVAALLTFAFGMPFYWVWEAGVSRWSTGSKVHQQQRRAKASEALPFGKQASFEPTRRSFEPVGRRMSTRASLASLDAVEYVTSRSRRASTLFTDGSGDALVSQSDSTIGRPLDDERARRRVLELLNAGKDILKKGDPAFAEIMDDEDQCSSPSQHQAPSRSATAGSPLLDGARLRPLKQECHTHFTRQIQGTPVLDLGMLWCFERQEPSRVPDILAKQLDRVFTNLHSHEERVEGMLRELYDASARRSGTD